MTQQQRPTDKQQRLRGYLASPEGVRKLKGKKFDKRYSYETIADKAGLASDTQVKNLFHPHWERKVQEETIEKIARVLDLKPTDIVSANQWNSSSAPEQPKEVNMKVSQEELEAFLKENPDLAAVTAKIKQSDSSAATSNITNIAQKAGDNANVVGQINDAGAIDFSRKS